MRYVKKCGKLLPVVAVAMLSTLSACGQPERPRSVSDFCLNDRRISAEPAPAAGADDPGNQYDTDETFAEIIAHNAVRDKLCATPEGAAH